MGHVWAGSLVVCFLIAGTPSVWAEYVPHVRAADSASEKLVASASGQSLTVANLIRQLDKSDVFVYVTTGIIDIDTAKTELLASPGPYRYVRISININQPHRQRMVLLGHELQHALEIAEAPDVRDGATMAALFRRIGWSSGRPDRFETHLAQAIGERVRRDLLSRMGAY